MKILREASEKNILLIEDDYNSEFCYYHHPSPSIQGLAGGNGVIYLGTFSRLLLPSIRLSFMVLPPDLLENIRDAEIFIIRRHPKRNRSHCVSLSGMVIWKVRFANPGNTIWRKQKFCAVKRKGFL